MNTLSADDNHSVKLWRAVTLDPHRSGSRLDSSVDCFLLWCRRFRTGENSLVKLVKLLLGYSRPRRARDTCPDIFNGAMIGRRSSLCESFSGVSKRTNNQPHVRCSPVQNLPTLSLYISSWQSSLFPSKLPSPSPPERDLHHGHGCFLARYWL